MVLCSTDLLIVQKKYSNRSGRVQKERADSLCRTRGQKAGKADRLPETCTKSISYETEWSDDGAGGKQFREVYSNRFSLDAGFEDRQWDHQ